MRTSRGVKAVGDWEEMETRSPGPGPVGGRNWQAEWARGGRAASPPHSPGARSYASGREGCLHYVKMTAFSKVRCSCSVALIIVAVLQLSRYAKRLVQFRQMDFEFAGWQMVYLLTAPQKVYRNFMYRKSWLPSPPIAAEEEQEE